MDTSPVAGHAQDLAGQAHQLANQLDGLAQQVGALSAQAAQAGGHGDVFVFFLTIFVLREMRDGAEERRLQLDESGEEG